MRDGDRSLAVTVPKVGHGVKGRSGPPGNMNGLRNPWRVFWRRRALRKQDKWILRLVEDYEGSLIAELGGADAVSSMQCKLIEVLKAARTCWLLGLVDGGEVGVKESARFMTIEARGLVALGLERREAPPVVDLEAYIAQHGDS